jgi:hypothetical protein
MAMNVRSAGAMLACCVLPMLAGCPQGAPIVPPKPCEPFVLRDTRIDCGELFAARPGTAKAALDLLNASLAACGKLADYRAQELVVQREGSQMGADENITLTFRRTPLALHMVWTGPKDQGKQILRAHGLLDDKVVAYMGNWPLLRPTFRLNEDDPILRQQSRFDVRQAGLEAAVRGILDAVARDEKAGGADVALLGAGQVAGRPTTVVRVRERQVASTGAQTFFFHIDNQRKLPLMTMGYDPEDQLVFYVIYRSLEVLPPLPDEFFQPSRHW